MVNLPKQFMLDFPDTPPDVLDAQTTLQRLLHVHASRRLLELGTAASTASSLEFFRSDVTRIARLSAAYQSEHLL